MNEKGKVMKEKNYVPGNYMDIDVLYNLRI